MTVDELRVIITANSSKFKQETDKVKKQTDEMKKKFDDIGNQSERMQSKITSAFKFIAVGAIAVGSSLAIIKSSLKSALDYIQNDMVYQKTMGKWKNATRDFTEDLKNKLGISRSEMRKYMSTMYNIFNAAGASDNASYKMSKSMAMLAQDMGAFNGITSDEALTKLQSGLMGNTEALRTLGILVDETTMKQYAMKNGFTGTWETLDQTSKMYYRYNAILEQTSSSQGYLAATLNSPNAQLRMLQDSIKTLSQTFGQLFIPVLSAVLPYLNVFVKLVTQAVEQFAKITGIKINSDLTESLAKAGNNAKNLSSNTKDANTAVNAMKNGTNAVGKAIGKASRDAKELKKTLAGFDEMNVLNEEGSVGSVGNNSTPSSSNPVVDSTSGGVPTLKEYDFSTLDNVKSKVDSIIEGLKNKFSGFVAIVSELVNTALGFFKAILKPVYDNIVKPLANLLGVILTPVIEGINIAFMALAGVLRDWVQPMLDKLYKALDELLSPVKDVINKVAEWIKGNEILKTVGRALGIVLGSFIVVLGTVSVATKAASIATGLYSIVMGKAGIATKAVAAATKLFNAVMKANPVILVVTAIVSLIAVLYLVVTNFDKVKEVASNIWNKIKESASKFIDWFKGVFTLENIGNAIKGAFDVGKNILDWMFENIGNIAVALSKVITVENFIKAIKIYFDVGKKFWGWVFEKVGNIADALKKVITVENVAKALSKIFDVGKNVLGWIFNTLGNVSDFIKSKITLQNVIEALKVVFNVGASILSWIFSALTGVANFIKSKITLNDVISALKSVFDVGKSILSWIFSSLGNVVSFIKSKITLANAKSALKATFNVGASILGWVFNGLGDVAKKFSDMFKPIKNAAKTLFGDVAGILLTPMLKAMNGIRKAVKWVLDKVGVSSKAFANRIEVKLAGVTYYEKGTGGVPYDQIGVVNDQKGSNYRELVVEPNGNAFLPKGRDVMLPLKKGTKIMPANQTKAFMDSMPHYQGGIGNFFSGVGNFFGGAWTKAKDFVGDVWSFIKEAPKKVAQMALNKFVDLSNIKNIVLDMATGGIKKSYDGIVKTIKNVFDKKEKDPKNPNNNTGTVVGNKSLSDFVKKYTGKYVDFMGGVHEQVQWGMPFGGQCASLAHLWLGKGYGDGKDYKNAGAPISKANARAGDIAWWSSPFPWGHVGIFTGGNGIFQQNPNKAKIINNAGTANFVRTTKALAQGGIVKKPTFSLIGEAGEEAVMPLKNNTEWISNLAKDVVTRMNEDLSINNNQDIHLQINLGGDKLVDKVIKLTNEKARRNNKLVFNL